MKPQLIFIYNADGGLFNTVTDIAHKIFSPSTYNCQLCAITHSIFSMREEWGDFLKSLEVEMMFLHRDEWRKQFPEQQAALPAIFIRDGSLKELVSAEEINGCRDMDALKTLIQHRLPTE